MSDPVDNLLAKLEGVTSGGPDQWKARCPAHDDRHASLSVGRGKDGKALVKCQAGCATAAVVGAVGLTMADLASPNGDGKAPAKTPRRIVRAYPYEDAAGKLLFQSVRFDPKDFSQRRPDGKGKWIWNLDGVPRVLYRLPELLAADKADWVFVVEGEKDADSLAALGLIATTNPQGAGKWGKLFDDSALDGWKVAIIPDRDKPGQAHGLDVAAKRHGKSAVVKIVDLPSMPPKPDGKPRKDVSDWIEWLDGKTNEELASALLNMAEAAATFDPATSANTMPANPAKGRIVLPLPPYHPFPSHALPGPLNSLVMAGAASIGCDGAFIGLPLLAGLSAAIGNSRVVLVRPGWREPAVLWMALVGVSGTGKSPAYRLALRPIQQRQSKLWSEYKQKMKEHKDAVREWKSAKRDDRGQQPADPPDCEHLYCGDVTVEALACRLEGSPRGLLVTVDELAGWFKSWNAYKKQGGDRESYLSFYDAQAAKIDRKTSIPPTIYIPRAFVAVAGGIQPGILQRVLDVELFDAGLAARFLFAHPPEPVVSWRDDKVSGGLLAQVDDVFSGLWAMSMPTGPDGPEPVELPLDRDATRLMADFVNRSGAEQAMMSDDRLKAAWAKLRGAAARLALVLHCAALASDEPVLNPDAIDEPTVRSGIILAEWFGHEAKRLYLLLGESDDERDRRKLVELISRNGGRITVRELMQASRQYRHDSQAAESTLTALAKDGLGRWIHDDHGGKPGRPVGVFELVHDAGNGNTIGGIQ